MKIPRNSVRESRIDARGDESHASARVSQVSVSKNARRNEGNQFSVLVFPCLENSRIHRSCETCMLRPTCVCAGYGMVVSMSALEEALHIPDDISVDRVPYKVL